MCSACHGQSPNTRFEVENIKSILHLVPGDSPYVWFDLVCIPRTRDGGPGNIARREIGGRPPYFPLRILL